MTVYQKPQPTLDYGWAAATAILLLVAYSTSILLLNFFSQKAPFFFFLILFSVHRLPGRVTFCSRVGLVCKLCGNEKSINIFKRELLFHSVVRQQEQSQLWVPSSLCTKFLVADVDSLLVSFNGKKDFPKTVLARMKFSMVPTCFWITCSSARNQVPSENRSRRGCLTGNAESRSAADTAWCFFDHYNITQCRHSFRFGSGIPASISGLLSGTFPDPLPWCLDLESLFCTRSQSHWL